MLKWFKRSKETPAVQEPKARQAQRARPPARRPAEAAPSQPLPEVVAEGNTQADWSAWEDSMTALDSQMQGLVPSSRIYVRETRPSQLDELDAFSSVNKKRDL